MGAMSEQQHRLEEAEALLVQAGCRVLRPFVGHARAYHTPAEPVRIGRGVFVDTETTGPDVAVDQIIQLAAIPFDYEATTGQILRVGPALVSYEEPTRAISPESAAVHGITMERLVGQRHDDAAIAREWEAADLIVAHNSGFDRPLLDRRFPTLPARAWGCSYVDIPWRRAKYPSSSLGALLIEHTEHFFAGHDAADDCYAALHCLAYPLVLPDAPAVAQYPLSWILKAVEKPAHRVSAVGAPFDLKDKLARRGYKWNDPSRPGALAGVPKAWYRDVHADDYAAELAWLTSEIYGGRSAQLCAHLRELPATQRFARAGAARA
ncbi:3'-5' exonuclease [Gemmatimonas sp.]